jgi:TonB family protein
MGSYFRSFRWSLVVHLAALLGLIFLGFFQGWSCRRKPREQILPIEFLVDTRSLEAEPPAPEPPPVPEPPVPEPPKPKPVPEPPKPEPPKPKPERRPIKVSTNLVRQAKPRPDPSRPAQPRPAGPRLTPEEIAKLLAAGAKASDRTVLAGQNEQALALIKRTLHAAWIQPTADQRGRCPVQIEIRLDRFGNLQRRTLIASSGSAVLDASAMRAVQAVRQIRNLPEGFSDRYPSVIIEFELE